MAHAAACQSLPTYSSRFYRKDFTLPQLFACLVVKDLLKGSYRGAEAVLRDSQPWLDDIGLDHAPDHNTLCRAAKFLLKETEGQSSAGCHHAVGRRSGHAATGSPSAGDRLDHVRLASRQPPLRAALSSDTSANEGEGPRKRPQIEPFGDGSGIAEAGDRHRHGLSSDRVDVDRHTGMGSDHPHFEPLVFDAWRRVRNRRFKVTGDAGYDSEANHELARRDMGLTSLIPSTIGRPRADGGPPGGRWRRVMHRLLKTSESRRRSRYTHRWQIETTNSMVKRNQGVALAGRTPASRERDMRLRVLTHNTMIL